jgi:hypothetical protein
VSADGFSRGGSRWIPALLAAVVVFVGLSLLRGALAPSSPELPPTPRVLGLPEMLGCWELDVGPWEAAGTAGSETPPVSRADSTVRALLVAPDRVLLLPDSIDEWRREFTTYRAVPVAGSFDPRLRGLMRWFLRADTLWLVWSDRNLSAGLALLPRDGRLEGAGRALVESMRDGTGPLDARVAASAWKVNCATGLRDVERAAPRP